MFTATVTGLGVAVGAGRVAVGGTGVRVGVGRGVLVAVGGGGARGEQRDHAEQHGGAHSHLAGPRAPTSHLRLLVRTPATRSERARRDKQYA